MATRISKSQLLDTLPPIWPVDPLPDIRAASAAAKQKIVVLDDDPTGTQTVYDVPVLTSWDVSTLPAELANPLPCFYILTNSRSLTADAAAALNRQIAINLKAAATGGQELIVISRSDSTLRGHFPLETDTLCEVLGPFDGIILAPYFEAGGRYTIDDVHYVAEGDALHPAGDTPFARDAAFGYRSSNLRDWVVEKSGGKISADRVASISLEDIRTGGPETVCRRLLGLVAGTYCVVNAAHPRDMEVFVQGMFAAERRGKRYLSRTAASFVAARLGLAPRPLLTAADLKLVDHAGGLTIVGSHVPKTTEQLQHLLAANGPCAVEISVDALLHAAARAGEISRAKEEMNRLLRLGSDVVLFTSRRLVAGADAAGSLAVGSKISEALIEIVKGLALRPRYLIAKGGITSSDLATGGLGVRRALVLGQILPGIPVWQLDSSATFPGLAYIVFPGNVGDADALTQIIAKLGSRKS